MRIEIRARRSAGFENSGNESYHEDAEFEGPGTCGRPAEPMRRDTLERATVAWEIFWNMHLTLTNMTYIPRRPCRIDGVHRESVRGLVKRK
eukprot:1320837-Amorphochlora_amoeboformis.AAC.1